MKHPFVNVTALLTAAVVFLFGGIGGGWSIPASAEVARLAAGTAVVTPANGSTVLTGFTNFKVRVNEPAGDYHLLVFGCDSTYYEWVDFHHDGTPRTYTLTFPALRCPSYDYDANLFTGTSTTPGNETVFLTGSAFEVKRPSPAPGIHTFSVSPKEFWPVLQDGYKDETYIDWSSKQYDDARVDILDSTGRVIASRSGWTGFWGWKGRDRNGRKVSPGRYRVRLTVINDDGLRTSQTQAVTIRHRKMDGTMTYNLAGTKTSNRKTRGNCQQRGYAGSLTLDCWAGRYAQADYVFKIPRNAHDLKWRVSGEMNCCPRGKFNRTGKRISPTRFKITVRVTNWRSYTINNIYFHYEARMMFRQNQSQSGEIATRHRQLPLRKQGHQRLM